MQQVPVRVLVRQAQQQPVQVQREQPVQVLAQVLERQQVGQQSRHRSLRRR